MMYTEEKPEENPPVIQINLSPNLFTCNLGISCAPVAFLLGSAGFSSVRAGKKLRPLQHVSRPEEETKTGEKVLFSSLPK